jgi:type II restriction/modification system DNA methylase subunit YeeA
MNPQSFIDKWRNVTVKEKGSYVSHFNDLCALIGHQTPLDMDPDGYFFGFEVKTDKSTGGQGFADVWYKDHFAWEYKSKYADLDNAYQQLLFYHDALDNPPLLIVSDGKTIIIRTKITNSPKKEYVLTLDDLLQPEKLAVLRAAFRNPLSLKAEQTTEEVTEEAAREFSRIAQLLYQYGNEPQSVAHFLIKILFCLFSEDVGLLPEKIFTRILQNSRTNSKAFSTQLQQLFQSMTTGGWFGADPIRHINGHLFDDAQVLDLDSDSLDILWRVSGLDWSQIKPSIFGTLFERSLDPTKRSQLGAHYTSEGDILLIVEPVLMAPLRQQWEKVNVQAQKLATSRDAAKTKQTKNKAERKLRDLLLGFGQDLAKILILDAACGSGNFLYVALRQLLNLWKEVSVLAAELNLGYMAPLKDFSPHPSQLFGIEINEYAYQLAQATIWIGYIQWFVENGYAFPPEPILNKLDNIERKDAILGYDEQGNPFEPEWPIADVILGNPPFLGDKKMRAELGDIYVDNLRTLYEGRIPGQSDLVCYWFEKARFMIELGVSKRAGLLATQGIRGGANRVVLNRIKETGDIFWAQSDREWILDGATVHVSMVGFDNGSENEYLLDGKLVRSINPDLSSFTDVTKAKRLLENRGLSFIGTQKGGPFDLEEESARKLLLEGGNPNGRPNSDVIKPWVNGADITGWSKAKWIIDFGSYMSIEDASNYTAPFENVKKYVYPVRKNLRRKNHSKYWWIHAESRPGMRKALSGLHRYICTPRVSKYRIFVWLDKMVVPDSATVAIARSDDYFFGILHSKLHENWARSMGTQLREAESGFRYTPTTTFEKFPFPWPPGQEPENDQRVQEIADAASELVKLRDEWLNPPGIMESEIKKRTLTNLYNLRPTWLELAHKKLDKAVFNAYGWPDDLTDDEILERLLALNFERAKSQQEGFK